MMKSDNNEHEEFEMMLEKAVKENYKAANIPSSNESFHRMRKIVNRKKKQIVRKRLMKYTALSLVLILFGAVFLGDIQQSKAVSPLVKAIQYVKEEVVTFVMRTNDNDPTSAKTVPPPDLDTTIDHEQSTTSRKMLSLDQAKEEMLFNPYIPNHIPTGFELTRVDVTYADSDDKAHLIYMWYDGGDEGSFGIMQRIINEGFLLSAGMEQSSGTSKELDIQGYPAILILFSDGRSNIKILYSTVLVDIAGQMNEEQILSVANSLKLDD